MADELKPTLPELISELILKNKQKGFLRQADDVRIKHGLSEDVLCLGHFDTLEREIMMYPQIKELFASIGMHLCMYEDEGKGNSMLFYLYIDPKKCNLEAPSVKQVDTQKPICRILELFIRRRS